jgi:hypothetical protein
MLPNANRSGFVVTNSSVTIDKDPAAKLKYTFDWTDWLEGDTVETVEYSAVARRNDPLPIEIEDSGVIENYLTYVELSGGQLNKSYIVSALITTAAGLIDRRQFRVNVVNRSA